VHLPESAIARTVLAALDTALAHLEVAEKVVALALDPLRQRDVHREAKREALGWNQMGRRKLWAGYGTQSRVTATPSHSSRPSIPPHRVVRRSTEDRIRRRGRQLECGQKRLSGSTTLATRWPCVTRSPGWTTWTAAFGVTTRTRHSSA